MTALTGLKLTAAQKPTQMSPIQQRRNKLAKRLWEQMELARAQQTGSTFAPTKFRTITDANTGQRKTVEMNKRVKAWWFVADSGKLVLSVRYGTKVLELANSSASQYVAFMTYGIDTGKTTTSVVPLYGQTGGGTSMTTGNISNNFGRTYNFNSTTTQMPTYGVVGAMPVKRTECFASMCVRFNERTAFACAVVMLKSLRSIALLGTSCFAFDAWY
jgi:hypothetical protein